MNDFASAYAADTQVWSQAPDPTPPNRFVFLNGLEHPVEDPHNLCALLKVEEQSQLPTKTQFHAEWLDLTKAEDLERFKEIWQRAWDGWYTVYGEEAVSSGSDGRLIKLLRYTETHYVIPDKLTAQLSSR